MLFCLQKKIFEIERCKDISMKIEKNEFDEGKICTKSSYGQIDRQILKSKGI